MTAAQAAIADPQVSAPGIMLSPSASEKIIVPPVVHTPRDWDSDEERDAWFWNVHPTNEIEKLKWLLLRWRVDPNLYAIECARVNQLQYQLAVLLDLADVPGEVYDFYEVDSTKAKRQILVSSGHGLGKTRTEAIAICWHKDTHKFSKTLVTAPTSDQITGQLWGEITKLHRRIKARWPEIANEWEILSSSISHVNPDFSDWYVNGRTARQEKPEGLQGAHAADDDDEFNQLAELFQEEIDSAPSGGMLIVIEEASGVVNAIREVLEGGLAELGARLLGMGNPTRPDGWFADDMEKTERYAVHTLDCRMSNAEKVYTTPYRDFGGNVHHLKVRGRVAPKYWEGILKDCDGDEDHDRMRVRVRGIKPRSAEEQVIRTSWVEECQARAQDDASKSEPVILGLDFGLTSDKHALAARQGFNLRDGIEWLPREKPEAITLDAVTRAKEWQTLYNAKFIIGDANGIGRGAMEVLYKYYNEEKPELNVTVILFNSGHKAMDDTRYYLRRDEMWHKKGRAWFANPRTSIPPIVGLRSQLTVVGAHEDTRRKIKVESKDQIKRRTGKGSGNIADAVLETLMVETFLAKPKPEKPPQHAPVFKTHFDRIRARATDGDTIR